MLILKIQKINIIRKHVRKWRFEQLIMLMLALLFACLALAATMAMKNDNNESSVAGLKVVGTDSGWDIKNKVQSNDKSAVCRVVRNTTSSVNMLELAADKSPLFYTVEQTADADVVADWQLNYLSTQGLGQFTITALSGDGKPIAQLINQFSGDSVRLQPWQKLIDLRTCYNYVGGRIDGGMDVWLMFSKYFPQLQLGKIARFRLQLEIATGQHVLLSEFTLKQEPRRMISVETSQRTVQLDKGKEFTLQAKLRNKGKSDVKNIPITAVLPFGEGVQLLAPQQQVLSEIKAGESVVFSWPAVAARADSENVDKPWVVYVSVDGLPQEAVQMFSITDRRPGEIYYVMTEDLEPIDAAGYSVAWGEQSGWLLPEELVGQVVGKAEALNNIAEKNGALWTHYLVVPFLAAAQWAEKQDGGGKWAAAVAAVQNSVSKESRRGHEYGLHLHIDYAPDVEGNTLSFNPNNDGLWADHMRHGWAHSIGELGGGFWQNDSKTGTLFEYLSRLEVLTDNWPQGQQITARVGSFDFGAGEKEQRDSIQAYHRVGLWGSSDADGNIGQLTAKPFGKELYLTADDSINRTMSKPESFGLVEFTPTPKQWLAYDRDSVKAMNDKVVDGVKAYSEKGKIKPGIHAIVGFTHAIFMMGDGDWRSVEGGAFARLDQHLGFVNKNFVTTGQLKFATAAELVKRKLNYSSPRPLAVRGKLVAEKWYGLKEYEIELIGDDFLIDELHPRQLAVKFPLHLRDTAWRVRVMKDGKEIADYWRLPGEFNDINFVADDRQACYTLQVFSWQNGAGLVKKIAKIFANQ